MIRLITESGNGNSELNGKYFPIPKGVRKYLKSVFDNFNGDKTCKGYKRLKFLLGSENGIEYKEMKRLKNYFDNFMGDKKSDEYILNGGEPIKFWVNNALNTQTTLIKNFKYRKKEIGIDNAFRKPHTKRRDTRGKGKPTFPKIKMNGLGNRISKGSNIRYEGLLRENSDYLEECTYEYDESYVFNAFLNRNTDSISWGELINPESYHKALDEFTKYGKIVRFPTKLIYKWMGIIIKNSCILYSTNMICGHDSYYGDEQYIEEFLSSYFGDKFIKYDDETVYLKSSVEELIERCKKIGIREDVLRHKADGQTVMFFNSQDEVDDYDAKKKVLDDRKRALEQYEPYLGMIEKYNSKQEYGSYHSDAFEIDNEYGLVRTNSIDNCFFEIGLYDWLTLPDGSEAISDYGLAPIFKILDDYCNDSTPEETLVIINRVLDVYHQRGDLSSIFIKGGSSSLTRISNGSYQTESKKRTIIITESQLRAIYKKNKNYNL